LFDSQSKNIVLIGQNLYSCFSNSDLVNVLVSLIKDSKTNIICILTTRKAMAALDTSGKGTAVEHYDHTIKTLKNIYWNKLTTNEERNRLSVYFHLGAASLSAIIRDPQDDIRARLVFLPKWTINVNPIKRVYCVVDRWENKNLFDAIYLDVNHMTLIEEEKMDWGQAIDTPHG
jgi:hypothetical protein